VKALCKGKGGRGAASLNKKKNKEKKKSNSFLGSLIAKGNFPKKNSKGKFRYISLAYKRFTK
jgi:hypothetical protein